MHTAAQPHIRQSRGPVGEPASQRQVDFSKHDQFNSQLHCRHAAQHKSTQRSSTKRKTKYKIITSNIRNYVMANPTAARNKHLCTTEKQPKISHLPSAIELLNKHTRLLCRAGQSSKKNHTCTTYTYVRKLK